MAAVLDLPTIDKGVTFTHKLTWYDQNKKPIDLTGYSAKLHIKANYSAEDTLCELTTDNGKIVLGGTAGTIQITIPAVETINFTWKTGVYDILLKAPNNYFKRLIKGSVKVEQGVTRW